LGAKSCFVGDTVASILWLDGKVIKVIGLRLGMGTDYAIGIPFSD